MIGNSASKPGVLIFPYVSSWITSLPPVPSEEDRVAAITRMLEVERQILAQLVAAHGIQGVYAILVNANANSTTSWFRITGDDIGRCQKALLAHDLTKLSAYHPNYRFFTNLPAPVVPDAKLMRQLIALRKYLVTANLRFIIKLTGKFARTSGLRRTTDDLLGTAVEGWLEGTDKFTPGDAPVSIIQFTSMASNRMQAAVAVDANVNYHALTLSDGDWRRNRNLRQGRVANPTADDEVLEQASNVRSFDIVGTVPDGGEGLAGLLADPTPSVLDRMIAREDALAELDLHTTPSRRPRKSSGPRRKLSCFAVRDIDSGETWPNKAEAGRAIGAQANHVDVSIKRGWKCKGRRLEHVLINPLAKESEPA